MKPILLAAAFAVATAGLAGAASAAPLGPISTVSVTVGPDLQAKARKYGVRDVEMLRTELQRDVERALARTGSAGPEGARLELVLADAVPNRPTFQQMGDNVSLSFESFGVGGAAIEGAIVYPDGHRDPVRFSWYETDIRQAQWTTTWSDASWTFDRFATRLADGKTYAAR